MRTLQPLEMEFIASIADEIVEAKTKGKAYVLESNGDTRYTEEAQDIFNELYDHYEDLYLKTTRFYEGQMRIREGEIKKLKEMLDSQTQNFDEFKAWVKDQDEKVYNKATEETFGKIICDECHTRTHESFEVDYDLKICEECYQDAVRCERCEIDTLHPKTYLDMFLCECCHDELR